VTIAPESLPDDIAALKRIIADMARDAVTAKTEIAILKFQLARYRRAEFGRSSEKLTREIEQLELAIESLETDQAERLAAASPIVAVAIEEAVEKQKPARRPLPEHLPREEVHHPAACACPHCGGALRRISEEVTETLDYVPGRFKVVRHVREKLSCRACDTVIAAPAPDHAIARGRAGAGLLAHIVVSKYDDHLPLYRQAEIFAREGVSLETSTLAGWVGATATSLQPLIDALAAEVMGSAVLHVDDTPVPVLAPGTGKTKTGGCGPTSATSGRSPVLARRRRCSSTRPTARASTQRHICRTFAASFTPTAIPGQRAVRRKPDHRGCLLGPCPPQILRRPCRQRLGDRQASPRPHRRSLRRRKDDHRPAARPAARRAPDAVEAVRRNAARLDRHHLAEALAQIRTGQGVPLHAVALEGAAAMP
jgi:transposase